MNSIKKYFDVYLVFIIAFLIFLPGSVNYCESITELNYDTQNFLLWSYFKDLNIIPIKDTYYPYGLIFGYSSSIKWVYLIYTLISPLIFTSIYIIFKYLFGNIRFLSVLLFVIFCLLTFGLTSNVQQINRYLFPMAAITLFYYIYSKVNEKYLAFVFGVIGGLSIFYDPGTGMTITLLGFLSLGYFYFVHNTKEKTNNIRSFILKNILLYFAGLFVGILPLAVFVLLNNMLSEFIRFIKDIVSLSSFAKTPLLVLRKHNMLIFSILTLQTIYILSFMRNKFKDYSKYYLFVFLSNYLIFLIYLQKYFIRNMPNIMFVYCIFALILMLYPLTIKFKNKIRDKLNYTAVVIIFTLIFIISFNIPLNPSKHISDIRKGFIMLTNKNFLNDRMCDLQNINWNYGDKTYIYNKVVNYLNTMYPNKTVYSYPQDPVFYLLLKQKPPPYLNAYEGSPLHAQSETIKYLINNNVNIVIVNLKSENVDSIPETVRVPELNKYIYSNYKQIKSIDNFMILKKI